MSNLMRVDPTRTITLRRRLIQQSQLHLKGLLRVLERHKLVDMSLLEFDSFLRFEVNRYVVTQYHESVWGKYTLDAFRKGMERSYSESSSNGRSNRDLHQEWLSDDGYILAYLHGTTEGRRRGFTQAVLNAESSGILLKSLKDRAWEEVKGCMEELIKRCKRLITDGVIEGCTNKDILSRFRSVFRLISGRLALIVNTELVRAFAEGQLSASEHLKIESVSVKSEWTTGDMQCATCSKMEGKSFSVKKARGMIPFHPNCKCCWRVPNGRK